MGLSEFMQDGRKDIFVVGLDDFNLRLLKAVRHADSYRFHGLLAFEEIAPVQEFDLPTLFDKARRILCEFPGTVDAIVGYWDFPTTLMLPILRCPFGLLGPSLESVLRCEHKFWSRVEQAKVVPDEVPSFRLVDPFDDDALSNLDLPFPFWLKPVKAHSSLLGYRIRDEAEFRHAVSQIRARIAIFADPLDVIMSYADLPKEIAGVHGRYCIAEGMISAGRQCTLEGYVFKGEPVVYGIVDSVRGTNRSSMERYEYPSRLPAKVQERMKESARRVVTALGLDDSPFNIEYYYHRAADRIFVLEINARISKSHSPLFDKVEGVPHKEVMIDIALGRRPDYPAGRGRFRYAAKFMPRIYGDHEDAEVTNAPDKATCREIERRFPGTQIELHVEQGMKLGDLHHRDSYSYELGVIFMGADSHSALMRKYKECLDALDIRIEDRP